MPHSFLHWSLAVAIPALAVACGGSESSSETPSVSASALQSAQCDARNFDSDIVDCAATYATCIAAPNAIVTTCQSALLACVPSSAEESDASGHHHRHHHRGHHRGECTKPDSAALEACHAALATCLSDDAGAIAADTCRETARSCARAAFDAALQADCAKVAEECTGKSTERCADATSRCNAANSDAGAAETCE